MVGLVVLWQSAWGLCLHTVLRALGTPISRARAILVFVAATFANQVTPFGQAGGEPISALLVSEAADTEYEDGLAAIASVDTLHFFPSIGMAITGFALFVVRGFDLRYRAVWAASRQRSFSGLSLRLGLRRLPRRLPSSSTGG
ncbi:lysylphosphatidylglycerol synthase domain-containing protein [Halapricum desulfuricans]|uniref:Putative flippase n=1 Tax=Halapricum desulfuricans TaxID=2841257 RepID=A0A897N8D0_9EURY|nr:putative flippase [Halapricum desulfuricans]